MKFRIPGLAAALALSLTVSAQAETIRVGVVSGAYADSIEALIPEAKEAGINLEFVEFTDWTTPNIALDTRRYRHQLFSAPAISPPGCR